MQMKRHKPSNLTQTSKEALERTRDQDVEQISRSLQDVEVQVVISGSIAAVQSIKFIRSLRRLGANVHCLLTDGGQMFITKTSLEWASQNPVITSFSGLSEHALPKDLLLVAPASGNFIAKAATGICDSPATTFFASYLGAKQKTMVIPTMHENLYDSKIFQKNLKTLSTNGVYVYEENSEEGRKKFPDPDRLAIEASHFYHLNQKKIFINMGGTQSKLDAVRFLGNTSSGRLGSSITEELYRRGYEVDVLMGSVTTEPKCGNITRALWIEDFTKYIEEAHWNDYDGAVCCGAILDYKISNPANEKTSSGKDSWSISLEPTKKLIPMIQPKGKKKVGFKLSEAMDEASKQKLVKSYVDKYNLSQLVFNEIGDVSPTSHKATIFTKDKETKNAMNRSEISQIIADHMDDKN